MFLGRVQSVSWYYWVLQGLIGLEKLAEEK